MRSIFVVVALALSTVAALAAEIPEGVSTRLASLIPGSSPDSVRAAAMPGLFEVTYGPRVLYISADGKFIIRGDLIDLEQKQNLTESTRKTARVNAVERYAPSMIVFEPEEYSHTVSVFTDINCGYCAKLHADMAELNRLGIRVRYLAYPRAGVPSDTYDGMVSVWCADDPHKAMTDAKAGRRVAKATCDNRIQEHYQLGGMLGVRGTPTIILENGDIMPGYAPPAELLKIIQDAVEG